MPTTRVALAACAALAAGVVAGLTGAQPAAAGTQHAVQTADSPSTGQPVAGGGSWIVNKPSGYYLGRAVAGSNFDDEVTTSGNWHYGRATDNVDMCGWVMPGSLGVTTGRPADSCSATTESALAHRLTIGRDFNAPAHAAVDGTDAAVDTGDPSCRLYLNYFHGTDFTSNGGHWSDPAGTPAATVAYRFTTLDGAAVVVRDPDQGWSFLPTHCVTRPTDLYNDDD